METHRTQEILLRGSKISNLLFEELEIYKGFIPKSLIRLCDTSLNSLSGKIVTPDTVHIEDTSENEVNYERQRKGY